MREGGGPFCEPFLEIPEGMGGHGKNPFHGGYGYFLELHNFKKRMLVEIHLLKVSWVS